MQLPLVAGLKTDSVRRYGWVWERPMLMNLISVLCFGWMEQGTEKKVRWLPDTGKGDKVAWGSTKVKYRDCVRGEWDRQPSKQRRG